MSEFLERGVAAGWGRTVGLWDEKAWRGGEHWRVGTPVGRGQKDGKNRNNTSQCLFWMWRFE